MEPCTTLFLAGERLNVQNPIDSCVYIKQDDSGLSAMLYWVDDIIIAESDMILMPEAKRMLKERFHMKDLGNFHTSWVFIFSKEMAL